MKKRRWIGLFLLFGLLFLTGCVEEGDPNHEGDEQLIELAEEFMIRLNDERYDDVMELFNDTMRNQITTADLEEIWLDISGQLGKLVDYEYHSSEEKEGYEIIYMNGEFEGTELRYKITFDSDKLIADFYIS